MALPVLPLLQGLLLGALSALGLLVGAGLVLRSVGMWPFLLPRLLAFAAGTLLGASFLGLLPEAATMLPLRAVTALALAAVVGFFLLEKAVLWRHSHAPALPFRGPAGYLILIGDGVHNLVDGVLLGAACATDPGLGTAVGIAILAHEIPQEVGDFVLLLESGLSVTRALAYNLLSAATIFPGVVAGVLVADAVLPAAGAALAIAAGGFLYVALADIVPDLHHRAEPRMLRYQLPPLLAGIGLIWLVGQFGA